MIRRGTPEPAKKSSASLAVLFADVSGSTRLYEKLGNVRALECIGLCMGIMRESAERCQGKVVKTIGDELLCVFPGAAAAAQAAIDMQSRIGMQAPVAGRPLRIRVGVQFGAVLQENNDIFGDCVNVAARMVKIAKPGQIIVAGEGAKVLPPWLKEQLRLIDKLPVKGRGREVEVYELMWSRGDDMTTLEAAPPTTQSKSRLRLSYKGKETIVGPGHELITLGREPSCDVVLTDKKASREHARIERRRGKFVLVDVSSNGTFLRFHGEHEMALKREEVVLHGRGAISFGHPAGGDAAERATFEVEASV
jgi:class 3 adenylate cyclase